MEPGTALQDVVAEAETEHGTSLDDAETKTENRNWLLHYPSRLQLSVLRTAPRRGPMKADTTGATG